LIIVRYTNTLTYLLAQVDGSSLADLSQLVHLGLRANPLSALRRLRFGADAHLSYLDLSECSLTAVPRGVPDTVTYAQLRRNSIARLGADSFGGGGASRLKILVLDDNRIVDVDGRALGGLASLDQLWMNNNRVARVPAGLPASLRRLMLDANNVSRLSADSFATLPRLETLALTQNAVAEISPDAFRPLAELARLDLSANRISTLPPGLFRSNAKLSTLLLSRNPLRALGAHSFAGLRHLTALSLTFVPTRTCLDAAAFAPLRRLADLQFDSSPRLAAAFVAEPRLAMDLPSLRRLGLQRTELARLPSTFLPSLSAQVCCPAQSCSWVGLTQKLGRVGSRFFSFWWVGLVWNCLQCFDSVGWAAGRASGL